VAASGVPLQGLVGCIVSNELLDAMPVHVVEGSESWLREQYVTETVAPGPDGLRPRLVSTLGEPSTPALADLLAAEGVCLAPGQRAEVRLGLGPWMADVASALDRGLVLTIDYGGRARDLYTGSRPLGTLTAYYQHVQMANILQRPGQQDLTAHVDFTAVEIEGAARGLSTLGYTTQADFLERLGVRRWSEMLLREMARLQAQHKLAATESHNYSLLSGLVRRGQMGDFKVLAQGKGLAGPLWGFDEPSGQALDQLLRNLPVPISPVDDAPTQVARGGTFEVRDLLDPPPM
jgi:SAM-dependent MidA family methyltransferase